MDKVREEIRQKALERNRKKNKLWAEKNLHKKAKQETKDIRIKTADEIERIRHYKSVTEDYNVLFVKLMQYCLIDGKITIDKAYNFMKKTGNVLIMSIAKKLYYNEITKTDAASMLSSYLNELDDDDYGKSKVKRK